jgi:hypothetical protein
MLDFEINAEEWGDKKKPYRWPDEVRDEVLARLLELNAERAREEALAGVADAGLSAALPWLYGDDLAVVHGEIIALRLSNHQTDRRCPHRRLDSKLRGMLLRSI